MGHILGLNHSKFRAAVMYAYYLRYNPLFALHSDDIEGIKALYRDVEMITNTA